METVPQMLRRGWNTKSDIIDVFITFFLLSYGKIMYQMIILMNVRHIKHINESGRHLTTYHPEVDLSITYNYLIICAIPVVVISLIFNILPTLLLILYPTKAFRSCLLKCHLNFIVIHIFVEKLYGCYRNGLDGRRDMRSFSGLYFLLILIACIVSALCRNFLHLAATMTLGTLYFTTTLTVAIVMPYKKVYMNYLDILLLSNLTVWSYMLSSGYNKYTLLMNKILLATPIVVLVLIALRKICYVISRIHAFNLRNIIQKLKTTRAPVTFEPTQRSSVDTPISTLPLIHPSGTVISYGTLSTNGSE